MNRGVTFDLTTRITGYQASLAKMKQAIEQLDPGSKISKSIQDAYKTAENYIQRLSKTPVVNLKSDSQLQQLNQHLQTANQLINNINNGIQSASTADFKAEGMEQVVKDLEQLNAQLETASKGPKLTDLSQNADIVAKTFADIGEKVEGLSAAQGLDILNKKLEEAQKRSVATKAAMDQAQKKMDSWKPSADSTMFSSKSGGVGTKLLNELNVKVKPHVDIDFSKQGGFSPEAINQLREQLMTQLRSQLTTQKLQDPELKANITNAFDNMFNGSLTANNLESRVDQLYKTLGRALSTKTAGISKLFNFGKANTTQVADNLAEQLKASTIQAIPYAQRLKEILDSIVKHGAASETDKTNILGNINSGEFEAARQAMIRLLEANKQLHTKPSADLTAELNKAAQDYNNATAQVEKFKQARNAIQDSPEFKKMAAEVEQLKAQVADLTKQLQQAKAKSEQFGKGLAQSGADSAKNYALTAQEAQKYSQQLDRIKAQEKFVGKLEGVVARWFSVYAVVNKVTQAIRNMISTVTQLDKTITNIAIVTSMSQGDLWGQMPQYTEMAREYAASIAGVYEVSQLYYQQGLQTADVMKLTEETLKLARISGLDYTEATNYMTNAVRSFKMEMTDAGRITDTYSAIAASSATSVSELAQAMSKTASSAQAVGSSFENTTAMMAVMIEATRQAPENIGSAMKSIISRYGQLKEDPTKLVDSQGEELSLNKVDKALQSVGISIHDAQGQFREFDDVIMELAQSWDTIDTNTQRYIATVMAGNRQQSRFLALVSSYDRLKELSAIAADSENTSQLQYLKTLDSVEAKQQQLKTSMQSLYVDTGIEQSYKAGLDFANNYVKMLNKMGTGTSGFLKAISQIGMTFYSIANVVTTVFGIIRTKMQVQMQATSRILDLQAKRKAHQLTEDEEEEYKAWRQIQQRKLRDSKTINQQLVQDNKDKNNQMTADDEVQATGWRGKLKQAGNWIGKHNASISMGLSMTSLGLSAIASNEQNQQNQGWLGTASTALSGASMGLMIGKGPWGLAAGLFGGLILGIIQNASKIWQSEADKLKDLQEKAAEANNKALEKQAETKSLNQQIEALRKLEAARYDSVEAEEAYYEAANAMAEKYPGLIKSVDDMGNVAIDLTAAEHQLLNTRQLSVQATREAAIAEYKRQIQQEKLNKTLAQGTIEGLGQYVEERKISKPGALAGNFTARDFTVPVMDYSPINLQTIGDKSLLQLLGQAYANGGDFAKLLQYTDIDLTQIDKSTLPQLGRIVYEYISQFTPENQSKNLVNSQYLQQLAKTDQTRRSGIARMIGAYNDGQAKKYSYLAQMSGASDILAEIGEKRYKEYAASKNAELDNVDVYTGFLKDQLETYVGDANQMLQKFWTETLSTDDMRSQFNTIIQERKTRTRADMEKSLHDFGMDNDLIYTVLNSMYGFQELGDQDDSERVSAERDRRDRMAAARDKRTQRTTKDKQEQEIKNPLNLELVAQSDEFWDGLTEYENAQILAFYDPLQKQVDNGQISKGRAQGILNQYMTLAQLVQKSENEQAEKIFYGWTNWTRTGIQQLAEKLEEQGVNVNVDELARSVVYNIDAVLLQIEKTISDTVKNYEEAISQATSGMSTDKALEFATKNGFDLSKLELRNGKWYADSADALIQLHSRFEEQYQREYDQLQENSQMMQVLKTRQTHFQTRSGSDVRMDDSDMREAYKFYKADASINLSETMQKLTGLRGDALDTYMKWLESDVETFDQWLTQKRANIEMMSKAEKYALGDALIQAGHVQKFAQFVSNFSDSDDINYNSWDDIVEAYKNNELPEAMKMYEGSIKKYLEQGLTPVYDAASRLLSGQSQGEGIVVTSKNKDLLRTITGNDKLEEDDTAYLTIKNISAGWQEIVAELGEDAALSLRQKREYAAKLWNSQFEDNAFDTFNTAISSWDKMDFSTWLALPEAMQKIVDFTNSTGKGILDLDQAAELLTSDYLINQQHLTEKQANEVRASLLKAQRAQSAAKILPDIIKDREKLSEDNIESLANLLRIPYDEALKEIHAFRNDDGTYRVDVSRIRELMREHSIELTNEMEQMIAESLQGSITDVQDAIRGVSTGYTNLSDMQKLMNQFEQAGMGLSFDELFSFNKSLGAYTLSAQGLFRQFVLARQQLEGGTEEQQKAAKQLLAASDRELKQSIDISNLISAYTIDKETSENFSRSIANYNAYLLAMGKETQYNATAMQAALLQGGQAGVEVAQAIADITGKELSAEDIATLYKKPAERMRTAMEQLTAGPGAIIDKTTAELIQIGGGTVEQLGNGAYKVTQSATNLFDAYVTLYKSLEATGQATIEELNNIVAKAYEYKEKADVTSMMSGLTDMTYSTLANIFTAAGRRMTPLLLQTLEKTGQITSLGAGKLRIEHFETFAKLMGIDPTSEAYISAFRTYNDEMIKINQQVSTNIKNAANEVLNAQIGSQINLTDIYARLDYDGKQALIKTLHTYGATLKNGILTIGDTANLPEIYGEIVSLGAEVGALTEADIHQMNKNILKYHREHDPNARISQILSEMDKSTEDTIEMVAQVLGTTFDQAALFFTQGENGYYKLDHKAFVQALQQTPEVWEKLSLSNKQAIENITSTQIDAAISMLDGVTSQNYTSMEDMRTVANKLNQLGTDSGYQLTVDAIFDFDEALNSWRLNVYGIEAQVTAALAELKAAGASQKQIQGFQQRTLQTFARNIDAMGYINSADKGIDGEALRQAIEQYNAAARAFDDQLGINADALIDSLNAGGIDAMNALTILSIHTGQKFSSADYLAAYQAGTEKFTEAFDSLHLSLGEIISDEAAEVLGLSSEVTKIEGTGHSLITNTVDLINSYDQLIARLANDPRTTLAQFNEAVVGKYEAEATSERTLASISNGMLDMNSFKERMTQLGYRVNEVMDAAITAGIANIDKASGNIKILNFDRFATEVLQISIWDEDGRYTQAYLDAKKAWNDAFIADITKTSDAIQSELNNLSNAKVGDYINISTIWNSIAQTEQGGMAELLGVFGAEVRDGILYLTDRAASQLPYITQLLVNNSGLYQTSQGNTLIANARKQAREGSIDNLYLDILKSRESLNEDNLLAIAQMFGVTYDSVADWLEAAKQGDGTYKLSVADVEELFKDKQKDLKPATKEFAKELIGSTVDNTISSLSGISTKVFNTSQMQATVKDLNSKVKGEPFETSNLFEFNEQLGGYVLTAKGVYAQFRIAAAEAEKAGPEARRMLQEQAQSLLGDINITELVTSLQQGNKSEQTAAQNAFKQAIEDYNAAMQALGGAGLNSDVLLENLEQGGQRALAAARVIAAKQGKGLSDSDITAIYQSRVNQLMQASDQLLNAGVGDIISSTTADMLGYAKIGGQRLAADGSAVLESADDLIDAYSKLYNELVESGVATLAQLNQTMSRKLAKEYDKQHGINGVDYLSKATSLTYEEFGEMFTAAGVKLTETMFEDLLNREIITETGGGTLRIENFDYIAKSLGIEQGSQAYTKAFKAYNDSLIELDTEATSNILDEVKNVASAQAGRKSKINLTQLYTELDSTARRALMFRLRLYGGYLSNGILTIQDNANIPALVQNIMSFAESNNLLLESELAELADTLNEIIKSYADTIAKALSGGLTNSEAATLAAQAKNWFGIDINFTKTYDGLKLSTDQANELYYSLKTVDSAAANIVFKELTESLTDTNESLSSASGLAAEIKKAEKQLENAAEGTNDVLDRRIKLYKEIQIAQMDSAESYNFMDRSLPQGMQGVKNYWDSWGSAFKTLNEIANGQNKELKDGETRELPTMEIQDFYNLVNEMNNLAAMSGEIEFLGYKLDGSLESASKLINAGLAAITNVDGEGAKINLNQFAVDFSTGVAGMGKNIDKGIKEMAESQIEMLDGLIQFLETVVAMEKLSNLDTNHDNVFDFGQIFDWDETKKKATANEKAAEDAAKIIEDANKKGNEELKKSLQQTKINGISIYKMLQDLAGGAELSKEEAQLYTTALSGLYQQLMTGDYDPNKLGNSVMQAMMNSTVPLELQYGDKRVLFSQGVQLEWDEKKSQWRAPDGTLLGSDGPAAIAQWNAKRDAATVSAMLKGDTGDMTIELDDRTITVKEGLILVPDDNGLFYANGEYYNTPEQASAALAKGTRFDLEQDLQHAVIWQREDENGKPIKMESLQGYTAEIRMDKYGTHWIDTKSGRSYDSEEAWYQGTVLSSQLNFGNAYVAWEQSNYDAAKKTTTVEIKYGYGIQVTMDENGQMTYKVGNEDNLTRNQAALKAEELAYNDLKTIPAFKNKANFQAWGYVGQKRNVLQIAAQKYGIVTEIEEDGVHKYKIGSKTYDNIDEAYSALSKLLFNKDGTLKDQKSLFSGVRGVFGIEVATEVKITNEDQLAHLPAETAQEVISKILNAKTHEEIEGIKTQYNLPLTIDWDVNEKDAGLTAGQKSQLISLLGGSFEMKALSLSATFNGENGDKLAKLLQENGITVKVNLVPGTDTSGLGVGDSTAPEGQDEVTTVTLSALKIMVSQENVDWTAVSALIASVPEDKRPTVEAEAKQYVIKYIQSKLLGGKPSYDGLPTSLDDVPAPKLIALATVLQVGLDTKNGKPLPGEGLTDTNIQALADKLGLDVDTLKVMIKALQFSAEFTTTEVDGETTKQTNIKPEMSDDLKAWVSQLFPDGNYTPSQLQALTIIALVSGLLLSHNKKQFTPEEITEDVTIPTEPKSKTSIKDLGVMVNALKLLYEGGAAGIDSNSIDTKVEQMVEKGTLTPAQASQFKVLVNKLLLAPQQGANLTPNVGDVVTLEADGSIDGGQLDMSIEVNPVFTITDEEKKFRELRERVLKEANNPWSAKGSSVSFSASFSDWDYLRELRTRVFDQGQVLGPSDLAILDKWQKQLESLDNDTGFQTMDSVKYVMQQLEALKTQSEQNTWDMTNNINLMSQAFKDIDLSQVNALNEALNSIIENATALQNIPWDFLVSSINELNKIQIPEQQVLNVNAIMRTIQANVTLDYGDDTIAEEVITKDIIERTLKLNLDDSEIKSLFERLKTLFDINVDVNTNPETPPPTTNSDSTTYDGNLGDAADDLNKAGKAARELGSDVTDLTSAAEAYPTDVAGRVSDFSNAVEEAGQTADRAASTVSDASSRARRAIQRVSDTLNSIQSREIDIKLNIEAKSGDSKVSGTIDGKPINPRGATSVSLAGAKGNALATGTLMGELGPELVVSHGRYFVVGQHGAEMVNLAPDAIVFNHLQTQQLLKNKRTGRGTPTTNERNAVAYAKGSGPALVGASEALATLKQIRTMWQSMLGASMKDLGAMAGLDKGSSSGGGGGGGGDDPEQIKAVIEEIERWYNLLRQIDKLEKDITYQESLQSKIESDRIANGQALYRSYKEELKALDDQIIRNQQLADLQQSWYERKVDEFTASDYGKIFTYNDKGLLQLQDGRDLGLDVLEKLTSRGIYGQTSGQSLNAKAQIDYLKSIGFDIQNLKYNDDGTTIDSSSKDYKDNPDQIYEDMMQNFWDNLDGWKDELDSIYDSYHDQLNNVLSNESKRNQLLQKIIDNQLSVEQDVLKAIESREQRLIDELQDERDAFDKSNKDFLDGLNNQLNQQKQMYKNQESEKELVKLRRQLAILQRSGGSGSQIRSLQDQIAAKEQDQYFTAQQQQIANIQKAADLQIKRMDSQIELMTQTLEYQKQHGLLWQEVYEVMAATPEQIRQFIMENTPDFQSASALDVAQKIRDIDLRINEWVAYRDDQNAPIMDSMFYDWDSYMKARSGKMGDAWSDELAAQAKSVFDEWLQKTGDINLAGEKADEILQEAWKQFHPDDKPIDFDTEETTTQEEKKQQQYYRTYSSDHDTAYQDWLRSRQKTQKAGTTIGQALMSGIVEGATMTTDLSKIKDIGASVFGAFISAGIREGIRDFDAGRSPQFASGGMVDYTGPAWVDGTPERPEAFLDPDTTRLVRQDLLGRSNSLLSFARDMVQQLHGASYSLDTNNVTEQNGLNIEKIDVNVKVDKVANDYDARAMGNTVMNEILSIARKSGTRGLSRR